MSSKIKLALVYLSGFLLAVHFASVSYINSSLLKQFVGDNTLSILYVAGSIIGVILLLSGPFILRKYGSVFAFLLFISLEMIAVFGMGSSSLAYLVVILFLIHISADSILYLCLDVNLEHEIKTEGTTGSKRGTLLTIQNAAWALSPLALIFLVSQNSFKGVYFLSGFALIPLFILVLSSFKKTENASAKYSSIINTIRSLKEGGDKTRIIAIQFLLNFFYAWMVIYLPLLLSKEMGFGWAKIGLIFVIMLLPFVIFELPVGILEDKKLGEKELLAAGFTIMFLFTLVIPLLLPTAFIVWALILFATRIGASLIEVSSESYFFKHVSEEDTGLISLFRMTRPLSYVIAPLLALPAIFFFSYSASFYFLSFFSLLGLLFIPKVDTK